MGKLNYDLSEQELKREDRALEPEGPPLTSIKHITREEMNGYRERTKWINNPAYQPQDHLAACRNLGIANPDMPRIDGLLGNLHSTFTNRLASTLWSNLRTHA